MNLKTFASLLVSKFTYMKKSFGNNSFKLLDVGAGNHSAAKTLTIFPACQYYGIDLDKNYNNSAEDFKVMKGFFEMDLTMLDFEPIPDEFFDGIWIVHVIEHLYNGDEVIKKLLPKLKKGGFMYVEYPGEKSTKLPSMNGTLNFKDDPSHIRLYSVKELSKIFTGNGCEVLRSGTRRNIFFIIAMPFRIINYRIHGKKLIGNIFWDLLGFAEFLWIKKKE
jgi:SAM-dependent methyltransferase